MHANEHGSQDVNGKEVQMVFVKREEKDAKLPRELVEY